MTGIAANALAIILNSIFALFMVAVVVDAIIRIKRLMSPAWEAELNTRQEIDE